MTAVVFVLLEIGIAIGVWRLADRARKQQLTARGAALFAGACAVLLLLLIATDWPLTDWPTPEINAFWDEHGVLSGTVQSVLLFGVGQSVSGQSVAISIKRRTAQAPANSAALRAVSCCLRARSASRQTPTAMPISRSTKTTALMRCPPGPTGGHRSRG